MLSIGKLVVLIRELLARWIFVDEVQRFLKRSLNTSGQKKYVIVGGKRLGK